MASKPIPHSNPEVITVARAKALLALNYVGNRSLRQRRVDYLARQIDQDHWTINNDAICLTPDNELINGQHRLNAIVQAGKPAAIFVAYNIPLTAFKTMDVGAKRSMSDLTGLPAPLTADCGLLHALIAGLGKIRFAAGSANDIEDVAEWWRPAYDAVIVATNGLKRRGLDNAAVRVGVGLRWAMESNPHTRAHVLNQYRLMLDNDTQKMDKAIATLWQRLIQASMSNTREQRIATTAMVFYFTDPKKRAVTPLLRSQDEARDTLIGWVELMEEAYLAAPKGALHPYKFVNEPKVERAVHGIAKVLKDKAAAKKEASR